MIVVVVLTLLGALIATVQGIGLWLTLRSGTDAGPPPVTRAAHASRYWQRIAWRVLFTSVGVSILAIGVLHLVAGH